MKQQGNRRNGIVIMKQLIVLIRPLLPVMLLAVLLGVLGYLCAIFLTVLAGYGLLSGLPDKMGIAELTKGMADKGQLSLGLLGSLLILAAVLRGILHYGEQYCNHYIAFKLLAIIRHKVFAALRRLCPAKLEGRDKGNLISILTSDIELLEVFYAHTISPIAIGFLTSLVMALFIGRYSFAAGMIALLGYAVVGIIIPFWNGRRGSKVGMEFRQGFGEMNSFVLDSLRGLDETIQYERGDVRRDQMKRRCEELGGLQRKMNRLEASQQSVTNLTILFFSFGMLLFMLLAYQDNRANFGQLLIVTISMMSSFGPVVALSNLSNNLNQTLASGERVLSLLEESPQVVEVQGKESVDFTGARVCRVDFAYDEELILKNISMELPKDKVIGIHGTSGSGKSTLLKLLMRFWDVSGGEVQLSGRNVKEINTNNLRELESYVTQEVYLFHDTIESNIAVGKPGATREEVVEAAKKASVHEFIMTLPRGYDTPVGELGDTLSGGEKQRIGIARAFLHDAPLMLLDEPTSNLDSLNEGIILKSLKDACGQKTVVLVSHRKSTMNIADILYEANSGRVS